MHTPDIVVLNKMNSNWSSHALTPFIEGDDAKRKHNTSWPICKMPRQWRRLEREMCVHCPKGSCIWIEIYSESKLNSHRSIRNSFIGADDCDFYFGNLPIRSSEERTVCNFLFVHTLKRTVTPAEHIHIMMEFRECSSAVWRFFWKFSTQHKVFVYFRDSRLNAFAAYLTVRKATR